MVALSRQAKQAALDRVLKEVLDLDPDSPVHRACKRDGIPSMDALLLLDAKEVGSLQYSDGGNDFFRSIGHRGLIFSLQALAAKRSSDGNSISRDWSDVSKEEFDAF